MKLFTGLVLASIASSALAQSTATIQIETASWGYAGQRTDVKADVAKLCDGKATCTFVVQNESFTISEPADPAPGSAKGLIMVWKCADASKKDQFPENKPAVVTCK